MRENMGIWVKMWLSLVICVKYSQCVKIWLFEWKYAHFSEHMDITEFGICFSLSRCVSHLEQSDAHIRGEHISLLLSCTKNIINRIVSTGPSFRPQPCASGHTRAQVYQRIRVASERRTSWSSKVMEIFEAVYNETIQVEGRHTHILHISVLVYMWDAPLGCVSHIC
jgi:hypothetical protein